MTKVLRKDILREIQISLGRFISIFAIVFIGVAFFAGVKSTAPNMKHSMDLYYDQYNLMDIRVMSTLGLTQDDIDAIRSADGVSDVQAGYFTDVVSTVDATEFVFRVHSLPFDRISNGLYYINQIVLTEGRYPQKSGECIIEDSNVFELGLSVGDTIKVESGKASPITDEVLAVDEFTIVGKAVTPYYLSYEKGASEIGSGKVNFFLMIMDYDFTIPVYTEALITVAGAEVLNSYLKEYEKLVSKTVVSLENIGFDRSGLRLEEIRTAAYEELNKATKEYNDGKQKYEEEISSAEEELNAAQIKLVEGEATLKTERENYEQNYQLGKDQIKDGKIKLASAQAQYDSALKEYNQTMIEYGDDLESLNNAIVELKARREDAQAQMDALKILINSGTLTDDQKEAAENLVAYYEEYVGVADEGIETINSINGLSQTQIANAKAQLNSAKDELDKQNRELRSAKRELENGKVEAETLFCEKELEILQGWDEYYKAKEEFDVKKAAGETEIEAGYEEIIRAENEIEKLSKPQWYVLDRNSHYSYVDYGKTSDRIDAISKIFPAFFFVVASLVCLTTMTRMVDEQRGLIGTYKALGYSNTSIASKYVIYASVASMLGGIAGLFAGLWIFPDVIYSAWSMMYTLPPMEPVIQLPLVIISVLSGIIVTTLAAYIACNRELKEQPSLLMRPKAPKTGKKIFLEKISSIWSRLSFSQKVTVRNLFRYKKRLFMTIIGIVGCSALLLAGFGLSNSISQIVNKQYKEIFSYHLNMRYTALVSEQDRLKVKNKLDENLAVESYLQCTQINAVVRNDTDDISVTLIIPDDIDAFKSYISLRERQTQTPIDLPDKGIVITEKLAKELGISIGDAIELDNGDGARKKVEVRAITENYIFHYAYMCSDYYNEMFRLKPVVNSLMIRLNSADARIESEIGSLLISDTSVASIEYYSAAASNFEDTVKILNSIVLVIILSAGLLAFVVLYNLTNINISERTRELATLKVLGFYNNELSAYIYRENTILSVLGSAIGLAVGIALHHFIMVSIEQDGVMFGNHIDPISFLYAFCITNLFAISVNVFMYRRLTGIPMVESLKSVE